MEDPYQSINKGIFVIPYKPVDGAAGPSVPNRPLKRVYDKAFTVYEAAHESYEAARTNEALDDIADWLDRSSSPPILKALVPIHRIPIGIVQNISPTLPGLLPTLVKHALTLHARDAQDLPSAIRGVVVGFMGEDALVGKRTSRTGIDEVEKWWDGLTDRLPLLLHVEQAQMIPNHVLAELTYILTLHPKIPFRLLLSVPFTTTFLASWTHIEPSAIDLSILRAGRSRKKGAAVNAILQAGTDPSKAPISIGANLEEELKEWEEMTGGGASAALKALKWTLLRHSLHSPLSAVDPKNNGLLSRLVTHRASGVDAGSMPGLELFELDASQDLGNVIDPAPRLAILQALLEHKSYRASAHPPRPILDPSPSTPRNPKQPVTAAGANPAKSRKRAPNTPPPGDEAEGGDLKELETLFSMWKSAGRSVNLWDWLEGFRSTIVHHEQGEVEDGESGNLDYPSETIGEGMRQEGVPGDAGDETTGADEETQTRLHASFVRFCEEARMLGLVRTRGKGTGKRGDEVIKGIGII